MKKFTNIFMDTFLNFKIILYKKGQVIQLFLMTLISLSTFLTANAQVDLSAGLVIYFPFNGNANDESGNGYNVSVIGASLTSGRFGNPNSAYLFSNQTDIIKSDIADLSLGTGSFSASLWFNVANASSGSLYPEMLSLYDEAYVNTIEASFVISNTVRPYIPGTLNEVWGIINDGGGALQTNLVSNSNLFTVNTWYLITFTFDAPSKTFKMYKNGTLHNSIITSATLKPITNLILGKQTENPFNEATTYYQGSLDDIRIYNRVINEAEVYAIYTNTGTNCDLFALSPPVISQENNNLKVLSPYPGASYQWIKNDSDEPGQTGSIHTNQLFNTEYQIRTSIPGCYPLISDPLSVFISMQTITVTVTEVVTATSCNTTNDNLRLESSQDISIDLDAKTRKLNINAPAKSISKLEISNDQGLIIERLPQVAFVDFQNKNPGIYTIKALNEKGSILKMFRVHLE